MSTKVALDIASKWNIPASAWDAVGGVFLCCCLKPGHIDIPVHLNPTRLNWKVTGVLHRDFCKKCLSGKHHLNSLIEFYLPVETVRKRNHFVKETPLELAVDKWCVSWALPLMINFQSHPTNSTFLVNPLLQSIILSYFIIFYQHSKLAQRFRISPSWAANLTEFWWSIMILWPLNCRQKTWQ